MELWIHKNCISQVDIDSAGTERFCFVCVVEQFLVVNNNIVQLVFCLIL